jgi:peptidoglycan biosynthesis protein MviN/MurJ (putative lipid II flippase)
VNSAVLIWMLRGRLGGLDDRRVVVSTVKIAVASLVMALAAYHAERLLHVPFAGVGVATQAVRVFGAIGIALIVLALAAHLLRIDEFTQLRRRVLPA